MRRLPLRSSVRPSSWAKARAWLHICRRTEVSLRARCYRRDKASERSSHKLALLNIGRWTSRYDLWIRRRRWPPLGRPFSNAGIPLVHLEARGHRHLDDELTVAGLLQVVALRRTDEAMQDGGAGEHVALGGQEASEEKSV